MLKYKVIKKAISKDLADYCYTYLLLKRNVTLAFKSKNLKDIQVYGYGGFGDTQVDNAYAVYGDIAMEVLLEKVRPIIQKVVKKKLIPTYSYCRVYEKGHELVRHKDRESCAFSTTLFLGGKKWPIYLSPNQNVGIPEEEGGKRGITTSSYAKGIKVNLDQGDMLVYNGTHLEHWREPLKGSHCVQVFLHYNDVKNKKNAYDGRPHLGLSKNFLDL